MSLSTQYTQDYQQAVSDYMKGHYQDAATTTDHLVQEYPDDPNLRLLRGHIYSCLQEYEVANEQYQTVLELTTDPELIDCARNSLADSTQYLAAVQTEQPSSTSIMTRQTTLQWDDLSVPDEPEMDKPSPISAPSDSFNPFIMGDKPPQDTELRKEQSPVIHSFADEEDDTLLMHKQNSTSDKGVSEPLTSEPFQSLSEDNPKVEESDLDSATHFQVQDSTTWQDPYPSMEQNFMANNQVQLDDLGEETGFLHAESGSSMDASFPNDIHLENEAPHSEDSLELELDQSISDFDLAG
ncbi:MAG: hypothetical protein HC934_02475 [Acaryochloridaceae cyanobacterium SU_2_1]|nr:hypothetical protein [Acaryochloridaceae cyanobacterium SU_2_1]